MTKHGKTNTTNETDDQSLASILQELNAIDLELRTESELIARDFEESELLAAKQFVLLERQDELRKTALTIPISGDNYPESFLELWRLDQFDPKDHVIAEALVIKVEEHLRRTRDVNYTA